MYKFQFLSYRCHWYCDRINWLHNYPCCCHRTHPIDSFRNLIRVNHHSRETIQNVFAYEPPAVHEPNAFQFCVFFFVWFFVSNPMVFQWFCSEKIFQMQWGWFICETYGKRVAIEFKETKNMIQDFSEKLDDRRDLVNKWNVERRRDQKERERERKIRKIL